MQVLVGYQKSTLGQHVYNLEILTLSESWEGGVNGLLVPDCVESLLNLILAQIRHTTFLLVLSMSLSPCYLALKCTHVQMHLEILAPWLKRTITCLFFEHMNYPI